MSDPKKKSEVTPDPESKVEPQVSVEKASDAKATKHSVRIGNFLVLFLIVGSLVWYLFADRYTPYTSQARVDGYVVGVAPKVAGLVTEIWVQNNAEVKQGQKLFQIDTSQYTIALDKAKSDLETTQRQVDAGGAAVRSARANLLSAQANLEKAQKDTTRLEGLRASDEGTISMRRLEISRATLQQAKAGVTSAEAAIEQAIEQQGGEVDDNNAQLKTAQSAVDKAELDFKNTIVRASTNGIITDLQAEVGQYAGTGSPVLTLIALQDVWVRAEFSENNLGHLGAGDAVDISFDVLPGEVFGGQVRSIGLGVSASQAPAPGTLPTIDNNRDWLRQAQRFPVVIEFDLGQHEALREQLRIGGQATVIAYTGEHAVLNSLARAYIKVISYLSYAY